MPRSLGLGAQSQGKYEAYSAFEVNVSHEEFQGRPVFSAARLVAFADFIDVIVFIVAAALSDSPSRGHNCWRWNSGFAGCSDQAGLYFIHCCAIWLLGLYADVRTLDSRGKLQFGATRRIK